MLSISSLKLLSEHVGKQLKGRRAGTAPAWAGGTAHLGHTGTFAPLLGMRPSLGFCLPSDSFHSPTQQFGLGSTLHAVVMTRPRPSLPRG